MTFEQAAVSFGWGELVNFSNHLPIESATMRAMKPEEYKFSTGLQRNAILADIFDAVAYFMFMFGKKSNKRPKPYPRPWAKGGEVKKIGSDPIPIAEFDKWYYGGD